MKNLIGLLLFSIGSGIVSFAMGLITDKRVKWEIIRKMRAAWGDDGRRAGEKIGDWLQ